MTDQFLNKVESDHEFRQTCRIRNTYRACTSFGKFVPQQGWQQLQGCSADTSKTACRHPEASTDLTYHTCNNTAQFESLNAT